MMRELYFYHELEDMYEELLNETHAPVTICGYEYEQGRALRLIDPAAFRCGVSDWASDEFEELGFHDMTEEEREHYLVSEGDFMYWRVGDE